MKLKRTPDKSDKDVATYATEQARAMNGGLQLAWAEPEPSYCKGGEAGRIEGFSSLVVGTPNWPEGVPLIEARLFGKTSAWHIVADGDGCRWVKIEEGQEGEEVTMSERQVLTIHDRERFGLFGNAAPTPKLKAIEYRSHGRLVAWRLVKVNGASQ